MDEESEVTENNGSVNSTTSKKALQPLQNCPPSSTTSVQQQQSLPNFFSRNNRAVIAQPQTIPPTPPPNSKELGLAGPLASPLFHQDESSPITSRTQLLNVNQMVRQQSDTTNNRRLVRSAAICDDDRPATSSNTASPVSVNFLKIDIETFKEIMRVLIRIRILASSINK